MRKMWVPAAIALLAAGCGPTDAGTVKASQEKHARPAAVLRVVCDEDGTRVLSSKVKGRRDGVHFRYINRVGADEVFMRAVDEPDENHGGFLREKRQKDVASHPPGRMWVACFDKGDDFYPFGDDPRYAEFEIVDPHDLWVPYEVACDNPRTIENRRVEKARSADDIESFIRDRYDVPKEAVRMRPGYPGTYWKGNPWVLRYENETIVYFSPFKEDGAWRIARAEICT